MGQQESRHRPRCNRLRERFLNMPQTALQKAAMTPSELARLIEESEYATLRAGELAVKLGYCRVQLWRFLNGHAPISKRTARSFRMVLSK